MDHGLTVRAYRLGRIVAMNHLNITHLSIPLFLIG
jgi:hypothetical protein